MQKIILLVVMLLSITSCDLLKTKSQKRIDFANSLELQFEADGRIHAYSPDFSHDSIRIVFYETSSLYDVHMKDGWRIEMVDLGHLVVSTRIYKEGIKVAASTDVRDSYWPEIKQIDSLDKNRLKQAQSLLKGFVSPHYRDLLKERRDEFLENQGFESLFYLLDRQEFVRLDNDWDADGFEVQERNGVKVRFNQETGEARHIWFDVYGKQLHLWRESKVCYYLNNEDNKRDTVGIDVAFRELRKKVLVEEIDDLQSPYLFLRGSIKNAYNKLGRGTHRKGRIGFFLDNERLSYLYYYSAKEKVEFILSNYDETHFYYSIKNGKTEETMDNPLRIATALYKTREALDRIAQN